MPMQPVPQPRSAKAVSCPAKPEPEINQQFRFGAERGHFVHHKITAVKFAASREHGPGVLSANEPARQKIKPGSGSRIPGNHLAQQIGDFIQAGALHERAAHALLQGRDFRSRPCKKQCYLCWNVS